MPFLSVPGAELYYETHGSGPAIVFAHGMSGNHMSWWQQVPHFRDRYTCVTISHRHFAPTRQEPGGPGARAFVDDLAALVDHLGLADVRLVGHSMGGWTGLGYALRAPGRVRALVMTSTYGGFTHPDLEGFRAGQSEYAAALAQKGVSSATGERMARERPALAFLHDRIGGWNGAIDRQAILDELYTTQTITANQLRGLDVPTLVTVGGEEFAGTLKSARLFASFLPNARFEVFPTAGHSAYFQYADEFNRMVDEFLATADRPAAVAR